MARTFSDQIRQVQDTLTIDDNSGRLARLSKAAVRSCYQDIGARKNWNSLLKRTQINTVAPYSTGEITYVASTGVVTLTGGTWPSWAANAELLSADRNVYAVDFVTDSTHLTLLPGRRPVVDYPSAQGFTLVQTRYVFPNDFQQLRAIVELERLWPISYLSPEQMLLRTQLWFQPSDLLFYTVLGGPNSTMQLQIAPPPQTARTYDVIYQGRPRPPVLASAYDTGSCTVANGSQVVTFTGTGVSIPSQAAGCIFRFGTQTDAPEGVTGDNPYVEEHVIQSVDSATQVTLADPCGTAGTGLLYVIDDVVDLEPVSLLTLFDRMCEARLLRMIGVTIGQNPSAVAFADRSELDAFIAAREADARLLPNALTMSGGNPNLYEGFWGVTPHPSMG